MSPSRMLLLGVVIMIVVAAPASAAETARVTQNHQYYVYGCKMLHYTVGVNDNTVGAWAYSETRNVDWCGTYMAAKTQWCENYWCETDGWNESWGNWAIGAFKAAGSSIPEVDLVRGWSEACIDQYPPFLCGGHFSGDLYP